MRVHTHTRFCFLCVLTLLYHQCSHCHEGGSHHHHGHNHGDHDHVHSDLQISELSCDSLSERLVHSSNGEPAENEQRYYIHQLFCRYGQKDRLDFKGFQSLLLSLGLGEVRVVGLEHEDLGHDHVAHLDILEVQEGRHSHSAGHPHPHQKPHISHKNHHENEEHGPDEELPCSKTAESTTHSGSEKHNHEKDSDHEHIHRHVTDSPQTQDHDDDHTHSHTHSQQQQLEHDHDQKSSERTQENNDLSDQSHHHHDHDHHHHKHPHPHLHGPDGVEHTSAMPQLTPRIQPSAPTELPTTQPRRNRRPPKVRAHQGRNKTSVTVTQAVELETIGEDQDHSPIQPQRGRREVPGEDLSVKSHAHGAFHQHEEVHLSVCLTIWLLINGSALQMCLKSLIRDWLFVF